MLEAYLGKKKPSFKEETKQQIKDKGKELFRGLRPLPGSLASGTGADVYHHAPKVDSILWTRWWTLAPAQGRSLP